MANLRFVRLIICQEQTRRRLQGVRTQTASIRQLWGFEWLHLQVLLRGSRASTSMPTCSQLAMTVLYPARDYNAHTPQERFTRLHRVMTVCHRRSSWATIFAYGTLASLEECGETFLAVCLHCNPVLDIEYSSLNGCIPAYLLWLRYPFTSNWRCSRSLPHLRHMAFVVGKEQLRKSRWYVEENHTGLVSAFGAGYGGVA